MGTVELDTGCNLILGKNGSGKSNYIQAVLFALSDKFKSLSKQEKRKFLHEGISSSQSANSRRRDASTFVVEVTLDNSSHRIPIDMDECKVRKSYCTTNDREDYFFNGKPIKEKELFNLFESGGFSLRYQSQF